MQIVYKEEVLTTEKDLEDVFHIREVFKEKIDGKTRGIARAFSYKSLSYA